MSRGLTNRNWGFVSRIISKAVMRTFKHDLQEAVGSIQLCAGQDAGCEASENIFGEEDTEAMILVDATNAFSQLNRMHGHPGQL